LRALRETVDIGDYIEAPAGEVHFGSVKWYYLDAFVHPAKTQVELRQEGGKGHRIGAHDARARKPLCKPGCNNALPEAPPRAICAALAGV
jgi:hypothetical protein